MERHFERAYEITRDPLVVNRTCFAETDSVSPYAIGSFPLGKSFSEYITSEILICEDARGKAQKKKKDTEREKRTQRHIIRRTKNGEVSVRRKRPGSR